VNSARKCRLVYVVSLMIAAALSCLLLCGCREQQASPVASPQAAQSLTALAPVKEAAAPGAQPAEGTSPTVVPIPSSGLTLTWWTTESFSPFSADEKGEMLMDQVRGFVAMNPDVSVLPILKAARGKGGVLDFLSTAKVAAPSVLPDVVVIDTSDLPAAVGGQLLQPLDGLLSAELQDDLYPFATSVGMFERTWYAVQFEADVQHLVYRASRAQPAPRTWADMLAGGATYIFAAAGRESLVNDDSLIQYLGAGGKWDAATRQLSLEQGPLLEMLTFYQQGMERRLFPVDLLTYGAVEDCWPAYISGKADMANVLATRFLAERGSLPDSRFAALPSRDGRTITISRGWALAIVSSDAAHRAAAAQFVEWLLMPEHSAAWTQAAKRLPTRRSALAAWGDDEYVAFLNGQLEAATFRPTGTSYTLAARWLQQAVRDVLNGAATPEEAAQRAVDAMAKGS
jgi:multiple sugar transport system substrate-binding protein